MPEYTFRHNETGETKDVTLKISELDQYKLDNPDWTSVPFCTAISSGRSTAKPDAAFRGLLKEIKGANDRGFKKSTVNTFD